jgi:hypothetical protein
MMNHIDLSSVLRQTVACDLYSNLVTRPTGAAVRGQIELLLGNGHDRTLTVIDFSQVSMIDFSCADDVIAKLLLRYATENPPREAYFLFRGVTEVHWEAIETVLERHGLALVVEQEDGVHLVGALPDAERRVWESVRRLGRARIRDVAHDLGEPPSAAEQSLDSLCRRRLMMKLDHEYVVVGAHRGG